MGEGSGSGSGKTHAAKAHAKWAANGFTAACCQTRYKTREALRGALAVGGQKVHQENGPENALPVCVRFLDCGEWIMRNPSDVVVGLQMRSVNNLSF